MAGSAVIVDTEGITETRALLRRFEPDLLKRLDRRVSLVARNLQSGAQANLGKTGVTGDAYRVRTRNRVSGFSKAVTVDFGSVGAREHWSSDPSVLAAIFEFARGVRNSLPQNVQRTKSLIATLNSRYGSTGRFLWQAWDDQKGVALPSIATEIKDVEAEYTARMR
jgi:hypothetical protein